MKKKLSGLCILLALLLFFGVFLLTGTSDKPVKQLPVSKEKHAPAPELAPILMESMTLEEKAGQMFLGCMSGAADPQEILSQYPLGGCLFFADFFQNRNKKSAAAEISAYQEASSIPLLMAVDEEGGSVVRVSKYPAYRKTPFPSPQELYRKGGMDSVCAAEEEKADLLRFLGLNVNLAPVCDMTADKNSFIYSRTLGEDAKTTSRYIADVVKIMEKQKIGSALKHFPGYGGNADTHTGIATDTRSYESFVSGDFLPFRAGIEAGAPCVLVSHNIVTALDSSRPASLSKKAHVVLRENLGFEGVILTDDLSMKGVQGFSKAENIAVSAILAGNDLLCTWDYQDQLPAVIQAVKKGRISEKQIDASVLRILKWKESLGLLKENEKEKE